MLQLTAAQTKGLSALPLVPLLFPRENHSLGLNWSKQQSAFQWVAVCSDLERVFPGKGGGQGKCGQAKSQFTVSIIITFFALTWAFHSYLSFAFTQ